MTTGRSSDAADVSGQPGAPLPPAPYSSSSLPLPPSWSSQQPAFPSSTALPAWPSQQQPVPSSFLSLLQQPAGSSSFYSWQPQHDDAFPFDDPILFGDMSPPPFAQPAIPPPQMQPDTQTPYWNQQVAAAVAMQMQGSDLYGYVVPWQASAAAAAAPEPPVVHAAPPPLAAVTPDAPPPPAEPASPPTDRRRGRPRGSTAAKSKPKAAAKPKLANSAAAAKSTRQIPAAAAMTPGPDEERPTAEQPGTGATTTAVAGEEEEAEEAVGTSSEGTEQEEEDEEDVEYAATDLPGVRFHPTDAELIGYLRRKYGGRRMPADIVKDFNVFQHHPRSVQEKCGDSIDGAWYVFTPRNRKYEDGDRPDRSVICEGNRKIGYWKSNVKETDVTVHGKVIGKTNALTFALGDQPKGKLTRWRMKEYRINKHRRDRERDPKRRKPSQRNLDPDYMLLDEWVICKLFYNKNKKDQDGVPVDVGGQQDGEVNEDADKEADGKGNDTNDGNPPSDGHEDADKEADGKDDDTNDGNPPLDGHEDADKEADGKEGDTNDGNPPSDDREEYYIYLKEQESCIL